jgi:hypothetical protein
MGLIACEVAVLVILADHFTLDQFALKQHQIFPKELLEMILTVQYFPGLMIREDLFHFRHYYYHLL